MRWMSPCWVPTRSPDSVPPAQVGRTGQACSEPNGGSPPVVNPNTPAQRRATVASAEAVLTRALLVAQQNAYDVSQHKRFVYHSFSYIGDEVAPGGRMAHVSRDMRDGLRRIYLG